MGARQRGDIQKLALWPVGVVESEGDGRVAPESKAAFHEFCRRTSRNAKNLISMTDGAQAYRCRCAECCCWFLEHHWVNHSRKPFPEFSRSQQVLANATTKELRDGMAGTMTLDAEKGLMHWREARALVMSCFVFGYEPQSTKIKITILN